MKKPHKHSKKIMKELCGYLGQDLDHPMCIELQNHMNECPDCQKYLETIKTTISLMKESNKEEAIPVHVKNELFEKLNLAKQG